MVASRIKQVMSKTQVNARVNSVSLPWAWRQGRVPVHVWSRRDRPPTGRGCLNPDGRRRCLLRAPESSDERRFWKPVSMPASMPLLKSGRS